MDTDIWKGVGVVVGMRMDINMNMDIDIDMMYLLGKDTENTFAHTQGIIMQWACPYSKHVDNCVLKVSLKPFMKLKLHHSSV